MENDEEGVDLVGKYRSYNIQFGTAAKAQKLNGPEGIEYDLEKKEGLSQSSEEYAEVPK